MLLFDQNYSIPICLKNQNEYVKLAAADLANDLKRVNQSGIMPQTVSECDGACIVIEQNDGGSAPLKDEGFSIKTKNGKIYIEASGYLGTMWGLYTFCEKFLGVDPCYLFNDFEHKKMQRLEIKDINISDKPKSFGFRGVFINDEDLLAGWKDGGGIRRLHWHSDFLTLPESVVNNVVETMLRLKLNLIIPATFLNIDNPFEKLIADCATRRGMYISQHHIEPVGVSGYTFKNYCDKFNKTGEFSFIKNPELMKEAWQYYANKWSEYDNVVWQIGLRGAGDRPVWQEEKELSVQKLEKYGKFISSAMNTQVDIIKKATDNKAKYFTSTLWMEGSKLMEMGLLDIPDNTTIIFADNGPNQMFAPEFYKVKRDHNKKYGIYYHLQYHDLGPHLAPMTGIDKLYYNINLCYQKGDRDYIILNCSNVREFVFELGAYAKMVWDIESFTKDGYIDDTTKIFGSAWHKAKELIEKYYGSIANLDISMLKFMYGEYFNYYYDDRPDNLQLCPVKDGCIFSKGKKLARGFGKSLDELDDGELFKAMYPALKNSVDKLSKVAIGFEKLCSECDESLKVHIRAKWLNYTYIIKSLYEWFTQMYDAKTAYDANNVSEFVACIEKAIKCLEFNMEIRKNAEYGEFENWYRGEILSSVPKLLELTKRLICRS